MDVTKEESRKDSNENDRASFKRPARISTDEDAKEPKEREHAKTSTNKNIKKKNRKKKAKLLNTD